ncbi:hypothetical protein [Lysinibacillus parviboronicapiens]|uniref:hypothetical protein n=1 Tax=Lysinibacillus parviboronicapiens TaxID=436516 RepID=UPI000D3AAEFE|nr:hypothetical protein [Lysinibacillus parviboronicapiens]
MRHLLFVLSVAILLVGCTTDKVTEQQEQHVKPTVMDETTNSEKPAEQQSHNLASFFPPDGSTAYFEGQGNEFASFSLQTTYLDDTHIAQIEDNGAVTILKVYRLTDSAIVLVYKKAVDSHPSLPTAQEAASFAIIEPMLQLPFEVGNSFAGWTIQSTNASVNTGTNIYQDVIVLTRTADTITTKKYFAKGVGLIRIEDTMKTANEEPFVVTSTLQTIE